MNKRFLAGVLLIFAVTIIPDCYEEKALENDMAPVVAANASTVNISADQTTEKADRMDTLSVDYDLHGLTGFLEDGFHEQLAYLKTEQILFWSQTVYKQPLTYERLWELLDEEIARQLIADKVVCWLPVSIKLDQIGMFSGIRFEQKGWPEHIHEACPDSLAGLAESRWFLDSVRESFEEHFLDRHQGLQSEDYLTKEVIEFELDLVFGKAEILLH